MRDERKTKVQLIAELEHLREQLAELQATGAERKRAERESQAALEKLKKFEDVINRSPAVAFVWRVAPGDWPVEFVSDNVKHVLGYTAHDLMSGRVSWPDITHPEDVPRLEAEVAEYLREGTMEWSQEYRLITESGEVRWFRDRNLALPDPDGNITQIQSIVLDVTERKRVEEELRREKQRVEEYLDIAGVMLAIVDADENITLINRKGCEILGYKEEELIGKNWFDLLVPQRVRDEVKGVFRDLMAGHIEPVEYYENPLLTKGGEERLILFHNAVARTSTGQIVGVLTSGEDITDRKRAEDALRESEEKYRELVENQGEGIGIVDHEEGFIFANPAAHDIFGVEQGGLVGRNLSEFLDKEAFERVRTQTEMRKKGVGSKYELELTRPDGQRRCLLVTARPQFDGAGQFTGTFGIFRDITDRKRAEDEVQEHRLHLEDLVVRRTAELAQSHEQLRNLAAHVQAAREEERTRVAREVHDELGQILTALKIDLSWLKKHISEAEIEGLRHVLLEKIQLMSSLSDKTIHAVQRISAALRPPMLDHFGLMAAIEWYAEQFQERTGVACTVASTEQRIEVDKAASTALFRICQEALTNVARHAEATKVAVCIEKKDGSHTLTVKDNGRGITESESHSSESLGILGMRERALAVGGKFHVSSRSNTGTTVMVSIPLDESDKR